MSASWRTHQVVADLGDDGEEEQETFLISGRSTAQPRPLLGTKTRVVGGVLLVGGALAAWAGHTSAPAQAVAADAPAQGNVQLFANPLQGIVNGANNLKAKIRGEAPPNQQQQMYGQVPTGAAAYGAAGAQDYGYGADPYDPIATAQAANPYGADPNTANPYGAQPAAPAAIPEPVPAPAPAPVPVPVPPPVGPPPTVCADQESCLQIIDAFMDAQPRYNGFLQVRSPKELGGGPCGGMCNLPGPCPEGPAKCRYDTYDAALAALYYTKRGRLDKAREILDAMVPVLYPTNPGAFNPNNPGTQYSGTSSGKMVTLLASSYNMANPPTAGVYVEPFVTDGGVDTGNNAWAGLAFAHYAAAANSECHAVVARDILSALVEGGDCSADSLMGYMGHLEPYTGPYRSTEHNIDLFGLSKVVDDFTVNSRAGTFVAGLFDKNAGFRGTYATGTTDGKRCDPTVAPGFPIAVDATFWNILADSDPDVGRLSSALKFALQTPGVGPNGHPDANGLWVTDIDRVFQGEPQQPSLSGFRFSTQGNGVQWENTAGAVMAMVHFVNKYGAEAYPGIETYIESARNSMKQLLTMYGGIPSSVVGGNYVAWEQYSKGQMSSIDPLYPGGSDTGLGWPYLRYLATAPTAWAGLMLLHQADAGQPVDENANPYAKPTMPVPGASNEYSCLPPGALGAPR